MLTRMRSDEHSREVSIERALLGHRRADVSYDCR
jgi:hypothetical protein